MSTVTDFLKTSGFYFLGNILSKLIMFFLLPIYTTYISAEHLGYYDVSYTYLNLITTFLFVDIYVGIMRFIFDSQDESDNNKTIFNGLIIFNSSLLLYTLLTIGLYSFFDIQYIGYIYLYGVCLTVNNLLGYLARATGHNKLFATSGVVSTFVVSILNVVGIAFLKLGVEVLYLSSILGLLVQIVLLEHKVQLRKRISFNLYDKIILEKLFCYSIPLSLNSLAFWLLTGYTSVMIAYMIGLEASGIYMVAAKFGVAINLLATCFNLAWQELVFKKGNDAKEELSIFYSRAINLLISFFSLGGMLLIPISFFLFPYMVKGEYVMSFFIIPLYIIVAVFSVISSFLGQVYAALKATREVMYSTVTACGVNLLLVPICILIGGLSGAIIAMIISYMVNVFMRIFVLRRYVRIALDYKNIILLLPLLIIVLIVFYSNSLWGNIVMCVLILTLSLYAFREFLRPILGIIRYRKND